jgi:hypothetical protein
MSPRTRDRDRNRDDVEAFDDEGALVIQAVGADAGTKWIKCDRPRDLGEWS